MALRWTQYAIAHLAGQRFRASRATEKTIYIRLFVVVICHDPCADERKSIAGMVDHGLLCSGGALARTYVENYPKRIFLWKPLIL